MLGYIYILIIAYQILLFHFIIKDASYYVGKVTFHCFLGLLFVDFLKNLKMFLSRWA